MVTASVRYFVSNNLERLVKDKQSSLVGSFVSYEEYDAL